jgi:hypothetical protein
VKILLSEILTILLIKLHNYLWRISEYNFKFSTLEETLVLLLCSKMGFFCCFFVCVF